jgi:carboxypeptidase PM20D1
VRRRLVVPAVALLLTAAGIITIAQGARDAMPPVVRATPHVAMPAGAAERLAGSIRIRTISSEDPGGFDAGTFSSVHAYLESAFPLVHKTLRRETVGGHSLLFTWTGSDTSLAPVLLAGHLDVVPVEPDTAAEWGEDPFGGRIADGFVWGRGAIDNKSAVMGTLEAVEMLVREGFRPKRTLYLAYGHDEEVGGTAGARAIAALLSSRGVALEMVIDEGGVIADGVLAAVPGPVALVGIAEKGFVTLELTARVQGGHSSLPPRQSSVGVLAAAVARLESQPMPAHIEGPTRQMFAQLAPRLPLLQRALVANLWLTRPLVIGALEKNPATNAMLRTTTAPTIFQAGTKDNVLPGYARASVNVRILPGDSVATVIEHVTRVVDDRRVTIRVAGRFSAEPSEVSTTESRGYRALEQSIQRVVPEATVAPYLVVVVTDARYYAALSRNVFRFLPVRLTSRDLERMHGVDERIGTEDYAQAIRVYREIVLRTAAP